MAEVRIPIVELAKAAQCVADIMHRYDEDLDSRVEVDEIADKDSTIAQLQTKLLFTLEAIGEKGASRKDLNSMLTSEESRKWLFGIMPGLGSLWKNTATGLAKKDPLKRNFITAMTSELEAMPRKDALRSIGVMRDLLIDMDVFATRQMARGEMSELEYSSYMRSLALFLKQKASELPPKEFITLTKKIYADNRRFKKVDQLVRQHVPGDHLTALYWQLKSTEVPKRKKIILAYNHQSGEIEWLEKDRSFKFGKKSKYSALVVKRANQEIDVYERKIKLACPWFAPFGKIRMLKGIKKARETLSAKQVKSRIPGAGTDTLSDTITDEYVLSFIYTEHSWSDIVGADTKDEVQSHMDSVDIEVALEDENAYCRTKSHVGARGIAQMMKVTHTDIRERYPDMVPRSFTKTACDLDKALLAIFLIVDRKRESIYVKMRDKGIGKAEARGYFLSEKHDFPTDWKGAVAIAYNCTTSGAATYAIGGDTEGIPANTKQYVDSIDLALQMMKPSF